MVWWDWLASSTGETLLVVEASLASHHVHQENLRPTPLDGDPQLLSHPQNAKKMLRVTSNKRPYRHHWLAPHFSLQTWTDPPDQSGECSRCCSRPPLLFIISAGFTMEWQLWKGSAGKDAHFCHHYNSHNHLVLPQDWKDEENACKRRRRDRSGGTCGVELEPAHALKFHIYWLATAVVFRFLEDILDWSTDWPTYWQGSLLKTILCVSKRLD